MPGHYLKRDEEIKKNPTTWKFFKIPTLNTYLYRFGFTGQNWCLIFALQQRRCCRIFIEFSPEMQISFLIKNIRH